MMRLQTYTVVRDIGLWWIRPGHQVYGWPYPDWGLCQEDEVPIMLTPMDVAVIYAMPLAALERGAVIDLTVAVREGITPIHSIRNNSIGPTPGEIKVAQALEVVLRMPDPLNPSRYKQVHDLLKAAVLDFRASIDNLSQQLDLARRLNKP